MSNDAGINKTIEDLYADMKPQMKSEYLLKPAKNAFNVQKRSSENQSQKIFYNFLSPNRILETYIIKGGYF